MPWMTALASIAGPVISGAMAGDAAGDAADTQSAAAREASAIQERARLQQRSDLSPWMQGGVGANNELLKRLGVGGGTGGGAVLTQEQLRAQLLPQYTKQIAAVPGTPATAAQHPGTGADAFEQWIYSGGNATPATSQIDEAGLSAAVQQAMAQQQAQQAQYQAQMSSDPAYGSLLKKFDQNDLNNDLVFQNTYKTALDTGLNALNSRAANAGGWGSGAALKALTRFGAQTANTYTGDAYNRNMGEKNQTYDFLSGVSRQGQSAAAGVGAAGIATGNQIASNALASGNAQSAGIVGGANALSGGIADATNAYQWNQLLNKNKSTGTPYNGYQTGSGTMSELASYGVF